MPPRTSLTRLVVIPSARVRCLRAVRQGRNASFFVRAMLVVPKLWQPMGSFRTPDREQPLGIWGTGTVKSR